MIRFTGQARCGRRTWYLLGGFGMLVNRIVGALTFRKGVYQEVEDDVKFTPTAWMLVILIALLSQLGTNIVAGEALDFGDWIVGSAIGTVGEIVGFAVMAFLVVVIGRSLFKAQVSFDEMVRTLGLASIWRAIGFIGVLGAFSGVLGCLIAPVTLIAGIAGLIAWLVAAREALDLGWVEAIVTVIIGFIGFIVTMIVVGIIGGIIGVTVGGILSLF
jgi:hypothetical protein